MPNGICDSSSISLKVELERLRKLTFSIVASQTAPYPPEKLLSDYRENFGGEIPFYKFGYATIHGFLNDVPNLVQVLVNGKICLMCRTSELSLDIQKQVRKQKKKRKPKKTTKGRKELIQHSQKTCLISFGDDLKSANSEENSDDIRPRPRLTASSLNFVNSFLTGCPPRRLAQSPGDFSPSEKSCISLNNAPSLWSRQYSIRPSASLVPAALANRLDDDDLKTRVLTVLNRCHGRSNISKFNMVYQRIYGSPFNNEETQKLFGSANLFDLAEKLKDEIVIQPLQDDFLISFCGVHSLNFKPESEVTLIEERVVRNKPSVSECYSSIVGMLVNMYPNTIPIDELTEFYMRYYRVEVDPFTYGSDWKELIKTIFSGKLCMKNGRVALSEKAKELYRHRLVESSASHIKPTARIATLPLFASELGLYWKDNADDEDVSTSVSDESEDDLSSGDEFLRVLNSPDSCTETEINEAEKNGLPRPKSEKSVDNVKGMNVSLCDNVQKTSNAVTCKQLSISENLRLIKEMYGSRWKFSPGISTPSSTSTYNVIPSEELKKYQKSEAKLVLSEI